MAGGGTALVLPASTCTGTGTIGWEQWTNVAGTSVAAIPTTTPATNTAVLTRLESTANIGDHYGARIRDYICPRRAVTTPSCWPATTTANSG